MKRLKDPIYGYIEIETTVIDEIIDTPNFQRLRDIIQTSYSPLYASAVHNRFVHSLGVYYLGKIVSDSLQLSLNNDLNFDSISFKRYLQIFEYACLLHDVGHAPFSHTGEEFYLGIDSSRDHLHKEIIDLSGDRELADEIRIRGYSAAPHELMSVIVGLRLYGHLFYTEEEKSFFTRCITGYKYVKNITSKESLLNCIISLLNSAIIDVDKLDYLIRDAFITGFDTVTIDYERLLKSIRINADRDTYSVVYSKGAISVIEDVVYAHDAERKWIQSHPIVLYDTYLLKYAIEVINRSYKEQKLFSFECLTYDGKEISPGLKISLLSDGDMRFLMKNVDRDPIINEYFSRKDRRHPLWKSEPEYKAIFNRGFNDNIFSIIEDEFDQLGKYLNQLKCISVNSEAIDLCKKDITETNDLLTSTQKDERRFRENLEIKKKHLKWLECLKEFAENQKIDFNFTVIKANQFNSGFTKTDFGELKINFEELKKPSKFKDITNVLNAQKSERDKFFYLFYRRNSRNCKVDISQLATKLGHLAIDESFA